MNILRSINDVWKKYKYILTKAQKRWGVLVIVMTLIGALLETLGVSIILPLVQVIMSPETLWNNKYFKIIAELLNITTREQMIWFIGISVIIIYIIKNAYLMLLSYIRAKYACKIRRELSVEIMQSYLNRRYSFFLKANTSELLRGMTTGITNTYEALYQIFKIMAEIFTVACICIYIMIMDVTMALSVIGLALICLVTVLYGFRSWMRRSGNREYKYDAEVNKILLQAFQGIKEVLVMNKQSFFINDYEEKYIKRQKSAISKVVAVESPAFLIEAVCVFGLIIAVCFKALETKDAGLLVSQLASFAMGAFRILPSLGRVSSSFNQIVFFTASLNDTYHNFQHVRKEKVPQRRRQEDDKEKENISLENGILVDHISWKYEGTNVNVLNNLSLEIKKGQSVAFIGQSGAGKTTLADIILGLLHPQEGEVILDGRYNIGNIPETWSKIISFVPQTVYLVDDTIRCNVAFGENEKDVDDNKIWSALEQAQLKEYVENLPDGLDTMIGERGIRFSGGQRQRIAIARALYQNPEILVLDEATSSLDNDTESAVMEAIEELQGQKTLIIIAHRLTTVANCDLIYEIKDGKAILTEV